MRIKANVRYDEMNKVEYYRMFDVVDSKDDLPEGEIARVYLDVNQPTENYAEYEFVSVKHLDDFDEETVDYYAVPKTSLTDWNIEFYPANMELHVSYADIVTGDPDNVCIHISVDGMSFDDIDLSDWAIESVVAKAEENGWFTDDDRDEMLRLVTNHYDYLIGEEDEDE